MWPDGVTTSTSGSQSQYVAHAPALVGELTKSPAANAAAKSTLFTCFPTLPKGVVAERPSTPAVRQRYSQPFRSPLKELLRLVCGVNARLLSGGDVLAR